MIVAFPCGFASKQLKSQSGHKAHFRAVCIDRGKEGLTQVGGITTRSTLLHELPLRQVKSEVLEETHGKEGNRTFSMK
jgi:hypothetical protein